MVGERVLIEVLLDRLDATSAAIRERLDQKSLGKFPKDLAMYARMIEEASK